MKPHIFKPKAVQLLLTITILFLTACGCTKSNPQDQLPPITQTGENTFGCKIDGKVFVTKYKKVYTPPGGRGIPNGISISSGAIRYFQIRAFNDKGIKINIYIPKYIPDVTTYTFRASNGVNASLELEDIDYPHSFCLLKDKKYLTYQNSGTITFTKVGQGIYAGIFNITMKNKENPNDIIKITEGRFDIHLPTLYNY